MPYKVHNVKTGRNTILTDEGLRILRNSKQKDALDWEVICEVGRDGLPVKKKFKDGNFLDETSKTKNNGEEKESGNPSRKPKPENKQGSPEPGTDQ